MIGFKEFLTESEESGWNHLKKSYPDLEFQHTKGEREDATWSLPNNFHKPTVHLDKNNVNHDYATQSKEDFHKNYHHPFFGVVQHERNEANVALKLMQGKHEEVYKEYPKYKDTKLSKIGVERSGGCKTYDESVRKRWPPMGYASLKNLQINHKEKFEEYCNVHGGIAHEIITSADPKGYKNHINQFYDKK